MTIVKDHSKAATIGLLEPALFTVSVEKLEEEGAVFSGQNKRNRSARESDLKLM